MDLILRGVERLPEWGRGVECAGHLLTSSGQAGYLALGLGRLEVETDVVGNVGNDAWGAQIIEDLLSAGVGVEAIEVSSSLPTALCVAISRPGDGERAFIGSMAHLCEFDVAMVQRHQDTLEKAQLVCVVGMFDLAGFGVAGAADVLSWARRHGKTTLLDTGGDPDGWPPATVRAIEALLGDVSYLVINSFEAAGISGEDDPWRACAALRARSGGSVIVKCGSDGSYGLDADGQHRAPADAVTPADAVGAGDSYDAGLIWGLVRGLGFEACMSAATAVATIYVGRREHRYPGPKEVAAYLAAHGASDQGLAPGPGLDARATIA
jgi:sugar/nucleoside kinase (ribokinase family)